MRLTKYVKSDGESWIMIKIRGSAHVSYTRLNALMRENGWIPFRLVKNKFDMLRKKLALTDPIKYPNWKQIEIPMKKGTRADLPAQIRAENDGKELEILEGS